MLNRSLNCKFKENKIKIVSGVTLKKKKFLFINNKMINLYLNIGTYWGIYNISEKQLEKEINFILNKIIQKNLVLNSGKSIVIDIYLIIIKMEGNLVFNCINYVLLSLSNLGIGVDCLIYQKIFNGVKNFNLISLICNKMKLFFWNITISQINYSRLICKIQAVGLVTVKFLIYVVLYFLNLKVLIKFKHDSIIYIVKKLHLKKN